MPSISNPAYDSPDGYLDVGGSNSGAIQIVADTDQGSKGANRGQLWLYLSVVLAVAAVALSGYGLAWLGTHT
jgi:hypothetical protein